jgi:Putative MetA-pathway of phenol degradation
MQINLGQIAFVLLSMASFWINVPVSEAKPSISSNLTRQIDVADSHVVSSFELSAMALNRNQLAPGLSQTSNYRDRIDSIDHSYYARSDRPKDLPPDKSKYNIFNPTPQKLWRDFVTDRPDKTTNPFTIDAGRFAVEADVFIYTQGIDRANDTLTETYNYFVPNFKVGLTNNIDLQVVPAIYNVQRTKTSSQTKTSTGFGDTTVRVKVNFWGNDGGNTAFGMMPFVKIPTAQNGIGNGSVEGGIIFPFVVKLSDKWDVGMQTELDLNAQGEGSYNTGFVNTVSVGHELSDKWSTYFEIYSNTGAQRGFAATFDTGLKYLVTENVQLDAGVNIGLTEAADAIQPFVGLSVRF